MTTVHLSVARHDEMIERGEFDASDRRRLELIHGVREMTPIGARHDAVVAFLNRWSFENVPADHVAVRVHSSLGIPEFESVPQPDILWIRERDYWAARPTSTDVLLIIEVSESNLAVDTGERC